MNIDDSDVNWCSLLYNFSLLPSGTNSSQITILFFILKVLEIIFAVCIAELRGLVRMTSKVVLNLFIDFAILVISFLPFSVRPEFPLLTLNRGSNQQFLLTHRVLINIIPIRITTPHISFVYIRRLLLFFLHTFCFLLAFLILFLITLLLIFLIFLNFL